MNQTQIAVTLGKLIVATTSFLQREMTNNYGIQVSFPTLGADLVEHHKAVVIGKALGFTYEYYRTANNFVISGTNVPMCMGGYIQLIMSEDNLTSDDYYLLVEAYKLWFRGW